MSMSKETLNKKQLKFVNEYLIDFNGTRSAKAAGYSERSAHSTAHDILRKPEVKEYLERKVSESNELAFLERHRVLSTLKEIAYFDQPDEFKTQYTTADRLKALFLIGKAFGLFWERPEVKEESRWEQGLRRAILQIQESKKAKRLSESGNSEADSTAK